MAYHPRGCGMNSETTVDRRRSSTAPQLQSVAAFADNGVTRLHDGDLTQLPIAELGALSRQHAGRYLSRVPPDDAYAFELFRRAICERDESAWASLYTQY